MTTFEIILTVILIGAALFACGMAAFHIIKTKLSFEEKMCKAHREIWMYYQNNIDKLSHLFDDTDEEPNADERQFLDFLFIHMELGFKLKRYDMKPRITKYKEDWQDILSHKKIRKYWEMTKQFRPNAMVKAIEKLIKD